jgi:NADH-quinone oxidoreductase subunit G
MRPANLVLPAASFAESDGTLVNQEGRAQRFFQVFDPAYYGRESRLFTRRLALALHALRCNPAEPAVTWTGRSSIT